MSAQTGRWVMDTDGVSFFVPGKPIPQPRHRVAVRGRFPTAYIPKEHPVHAWKSLVRSCARKALQDRIDEMLDRRGFWTAVDDWDYSAAINIQVTFFLPKAKSNKKVRPTGKPDVDNLGKAVLDAMTGVVWVDDSQVLAMRWDKRWAEDHQSIGAVILVWHD